jgi:hypothetical protein
LQEYGGIEVEKQSFWNEAVQSFSPPEVDFQAMVEGVI